MNHPVPAGPAVLKRRNGRVCRGEFREYDIADGYFKVSPQHAPPFLGPTTALISKAIFPVLFSKTEQPTTIKQASVIMLLSSYVDIYFQCFLIRGENIPIWYELYSWRKMSIEFPCLMNGRFYF